MRKYKQPFVLALAYMIRFLTMKRVGNVDGLGSFRILGHEKQIRAAGALQRLFLESKGQPNLEALRKHMHTAFYYLLAPPFLEEYLISSPTDQVLFLMSLVSHQYFIASNALQSLCSGLQYCFRCVVVHVARLKDCNMASYIPWTGQSCEVASSESDDTEDEISATGSGVLEGDDIEQDKWLPSDIEGSDDEPAEGQFNTQNIRTRL